MYYNKKRFFYCLLALVFIFMVNGLSGQAQSQERYPSKAINIICGQTAGALDLGTRAALPYLSKTWGVPVNVVSKPGGNSVPAQLEVYNARPDGYTLFADGLNFCSLLPVVVKDLPFEVMDRTFIGTTMFGLGAIIVPSNSPWKSLDELVADIKKDPGALTWSSQGPATGSDFMTRRFLISINVDPSKTKCVTTTGGRKSAALVAGGHIDYLFASITSARPHLEAGNVRALAGQWKEGENWLENVPSVFEAGYPEAYSGLWIGFSGTPNMPSYIVDIWNTALKEMEKDPEYLGRVKKMGFRPMYLNPSEMKELALKDMQAAMEVYGRKK
jgi:tripartite-type tricarboxylate transporter receptor subunit TctC